MRYTNTFHEQLNPKENQEKGKASYTELNKNLMVAFLN